MTKSASSYVEGIILDLSKSLNCLFFMPFIRTGVKETKEQLSIIGGLII